MCRSSKVARLSPQQQGVELYSCGWPQKQRNSWRIRAAHHWHCLWTFVVWQTSISQDSSSIRSSKLTLLMSLMRGLPAVLAPAVPEHRCVGYNDAHHRMEEGGPLVLLIESILMSSCMWFNFHHFSAFSVFSLLVQAREKAEMYRECKKGDRMYLLHTVAEHTFLICDTNKSICLRVREYCWEQVRCFGIKPVGKSKNMMQCKKTTPSSTSVFRWWENYQGSSDGLGWYPQGRCSLTWAELSWQLSLLEVSGA